MSLFWCLSFRWSIALINVTGHIFVRLLSKWTSPCSVLKQPSFFLLSDCPKDWNPEAEHVYVSDFPCITPSVVAQYLSGWMLVLTSIQLSKRMVFGLPAWIDEPRNMSKWIGTIWAAWHRVERGGNELPSIGGSRMSLKWLSSSFSLVFLPSLLTWASPEFLCSCKSIHLTLKLNRQEVTLHLSGHRQTQDAAGPGWGCYPRWIPAGEEQSPLAQLHV